ncbi:uncharacterized protein [Coffea arabica]|uniref:Uncharacterized protein isoform X2 n=1 Tax=Coffea arabica TaxID=13443 RepID=A0ABM4WXR5_COFAR
MGHAKEDCKADDHASKLKHFGKEVPVAGTEGWMADRRTVKAMKAIYAPQVGCVGVGAHGERCGEGDSVATQGGLEIQESGKTGTKDKVEVVTHGCALGMGGAPQDGCVGMVTHGVGCEEGDSVASQEKLEVQVLGKTGTKDKVEEDTHGSASSMGDEMEISPPKDGAETLGGNSDLVWEHRGTCALGRGAPANVNECMLRPSSEQCLEAVDKSAAGMVHQWEKEQQSESTFEEDFQVAHVTWKWKLVTLD